METKYLSKAKVVSAIPVLALGAVLMLGAPQADAAATPALNFTQKSLTVSVTNGKNIYKKATIKIKNKQKFNIKKVTYKSQDDRVASVSKKGEVTALTKGNTKIIVTIKYQKKQASNSKIIKKKIPVSLTVSYKYLAEVPQTGMQYDEDGKAMPIYPYTPPYDKSGVYSNEASYIQRFPVYVETDRDTDGDGKRDLILAIVQVPKSAVDGYYKAPAVMIANPYMIDGHRSGNESAKLEKIKNGAFDYNLLNISPEARTPEDEVSTADAASGASVWFDNFVYTDGRLSSQDQMKEMDYYMVRGYAFVTSPGLGGDKESEGLQLCGELAEAESYAAIIEWLHGDRNAYSDPDGKHLIRADWCDGHASMTGISYLGTLTYEVATLGVDGLDTVIPVGGISSWYDYVNAQGVPINEGTHVYMANLGDFCAKRFYYNSTKEQNSDPFFKTYKNYVLQKNYDEAASLSRYTEYWERFAFHDGGFAGHKNIKIPALIVEGLNDINVTPKQAMLMRESFVNAGQPCKMILHQGMHDVLEDEDFVVKVNGEYYCDIVNKWLSHYLEGVDNGIENMSDYTIQSNVDGSWTTYNGEPKTDTMEIKPTDEEKETTIKFNSKVFGSYSKTVEDIQLANPDMHTIWSQDITEDTTISGVCEAHLRVKMPDTRKNNAHIYVRLVDESDKKFPVYVDDPDYGRGYALTTFVDGSMVSSGSGLKDRYEIIFDTKKLKSRVITTGYVSLAMPNSGFKPEDNRAPAEQTVDNTYYDYTIYMIPETYTVRKGHTLRLEIMPCSENQNNSGTLLKSAYTEEVTSQTIMSKKYEFTIDNEQSRADIPVVSGE